MFTCPKNAIEIFRYHNMQNLKINMKNMDFFIFLGKILIVIKYYSLD